MLPVNRNKHGHPVNRVSFRVQENSWCDTREYGLWIPDNWKIRPGTSYMRQQASVLVLEDLKKRHHDDLFWRS